MAKTDPPIRWRAFTLIELLIVVAIIAMLAALLLPVLQRAKEQGRRAACINNLHQIGIAVQSFADDHDGAVPLRTVNSYQQGWGWPDCSSMGGGAGYDEGWIYMRPFLPYLGNSKQVFYCPSAKPFPGSSIGRVSYFGRTWARGVPWWDCTNYQEYKVNPQPFSFNAPVATWSIVGATPQMPWVMEFTVGPDPVLFGTSYVPPYGNHGDRSHPQALHVLWADGGVTAETKKFYLDGAHWWWTPNGTR